MWVRRNSASCSQYQSAESCVRLRKRAALARSARSAVRARMAPPAGLSLPRVIAFLAPAVRLRRVAIAPQLPRRQFTGAPSPRPDPMAKKLCARGLSPGAFAGEQVEAARHYDGGADPDCA